MEAIWADVGPKLQAIPLPSGVTFDDMLPSAEASGGREESRNSLVNNNQSNFRDEDDEDYSGA